MHANPGLRGEVGLADRVWWLYDPHLAPERHDVHDLGAHAGERLIARCVAVRRAGGPVQYVRGVFKRIVPICFGTVARGEVGANLLHA